MRLPTDWVQVAEISNKEILPLLFSLATERIEKERLNIPVAAFQFWEQQDFKALLKETMDKSAFYDVLESRRRKMQGILKLHPEIAKEYFNQIWSKPITKYRIIKKFKTGLEQPVRFSSYSAFSPVPAASLCSATGMDGTLNCRLHTIKGIPQ